MKKLLVRLLVTVLVIVIVVVVVGYFWMDTLAKQAVQRGGKYAMDVETTVDSVSLSPLAGTLRMKQLKIANPDGFSGPHLVSTGTFDLELDTGSLFGDTVELKKFELDGLDMYIEQTVSGNNVSAILANIERRFGGGDEAKDDQKAEGKKVKVDLIMIRNVVARVKVLGGEELTVKVPEIKMEHVTDDNAAGVALPELMARILPAIVAAVLEKGGNVLPAGLATALQGDIGDVAGVLGGQAEKMIQDVRGNIEKAIGDQIKKGVGDAMGDLLGGKKDANDANKPKDPSGGLLDGILGGKK